MNANRILIVDDDPTLRTILSDMLSNSGYDPVTAATGPEALDIMRGGMADIAVALIDLRLDDTSGLDVMQKIKESSPEIECIILTAHATQETAIEAVNLGAYSYVLKSYEMDQLLMTIKRACDKRNAERALRESEEALRESEARYRSVFEGTNTPTLIIEEDTTISMVNTAFEKTSGYSKKEVEGRMSWTALVTPQDLDRVKKHHEQRRNGGNDIPSEYEASVFDKGGDVRDILLTVGLIPGTGRSVCSLVDITESKRAEITLRENEERYRTILEAIEEGYFESDLTGRYTFLNDAMCRILGYGRDELIGMKYSDHNTDPDTRKRVYEQFSELYRTGEPIEVGDCVFYRKDGKRGILEEKASLRRDSEGNPIGFRGIARDVTERREAGRALKESEERYRALFDHNPIETIIVDREARVTGYNFAKKNSGGRLPVINKDIMYKDYASRHEINMLGELKECIKSGISKEFLDRPYRDKFLDIKIAPFSEGAIITTVDVTGRKQAETQHMHLKAQLQQAQKMEAIGTLAGGLAHDFNNLLMGIQGNASLTLLDMDASHPHYEKLRNIEQYVRDGAKLTGQLLGFARGGKYEVKPTDLNKLIKKNSGMFGRTKKEIKIHRKFQKDIWLVEADQGQMEQTLLNIYVNAWQAMPGGGEIYLQTENVTLDDTYVIAHNLEPGKYVKISVTDTGTGMNEETAKRVFDPFFTTKEMGRGTGLGLASAYGIIKNHNGIITVYSEEGLGTTFNIYLPALDQVADDHRVQKTKEQPLTGSETILLVDDEDLIIDVGCEILNFLGYTVHFARSGREAIEVYRKHGDQIDLVILDMIMPEMGGAEAYDALKKINPDIKVLLSSGYSINGQARDIMKKGCDGFIQKPFSIEQISRKIRELLPE